MIKVASNVYKIQCDSNIYFLELEKNILIDCGNREYYDKVKEELKGKKIDVVIFTHLHYDHIGCFDLFPDATFYASETEIKNFEKDKKAFIFDSELLAIFDIELNVVKDMFGLKIIKTPGHTAGSISLFYEKEKVLFSGDTMFNNGHGRVDLPTSKPDEMEKSLKKLEKLDFDILCSGHDY